MKYTIKDLVKLQNEIQSKKRELINKNLSKQILKGIEIENFLIDDAYLKIENKLKGISENYGIDTADFSEMNELDGVSFRYDIDDFYKELLNNYTSDILENAFDIFQENYHGYLNKEDGNYITIGFDSFEDVFLFSDRNKKILSFLSNKIEYKNDLHAQLIAEKLFIENGQGGSIYNIKDYDNTPYKFDSVKLPSYLKAFNENDKEVLKRLDLIIDAIDLKHELYDNNDSLDSFDDLITNEIDKKFPEIDFSDSELIDFEIDENAILKGKLRLSIESEISINDEYKNEKFSIEIDLKKVK